MSDDEIFEQLAEISKTASDDRKERLHAEMAALVSDNAHLKSVMARLSKEHSDAFIRALAMDLLQRSQR